MNADVETGTLHYVIPARTISGSAQELLEELDDMVAALQLVRQEIVSRTPKPAKDASPLPAWARWVAGAGVALVALGIGLAVDAAPPLATAGTLCGIVGLLFVIVPTWPDFGRRIRW